MLPPSSSRPLFSFASFFKNIFSFFLSRLLCRNLLGDRKAFETRCRSPSSSLKLNLVGGSSLAIYTATNQPSRNSNQIYIGSLTHTELSQNGKVKRQERYFTYSIIWSYYRDILPHSAVCVYIYRIAKRFLEWDGT